MGSTDYSKYKEGYIRYRNEHREERKRACRIYYAEHKEELKRKDRERRRKYCLCVKGRLRTDLNKRDYTGYCELCGRIIGEGITILAYHHWDDSNPSKGIWVCRGCHRIAELYEKNQLFVIERYIRLKKYLNRQYKIRKELKVDLN